MNIWFVTARLWCQNHRKQWKDGTIATKETGANLHPSLGKTINKDNIIPGILWLVAPNNKQTETEDRCRLHSCMYKDRVLIISMCGRPSMVATTCDMLLVQCELNVLSHLFCDCALLPPYRWEPLSDISRQQETSVDFFFPFHDEEQLSQCSILHSIVYAFIWYWQGLNHWEKKR